MKQSHQRGYTTLENKFWKKTKPYQIISYNNNITNNTIKMYWMQIKNRAELQNSWHMTLYILQELVVHT